jgi:hypothetical protein
MIDNIIFMTVLLLVVWLCYTGSKRDKQERQEQEQQRQKLAQASKNKAGAGNMPSQ